MWLGIRLFPSPPQSLRCTCGQIMDEFVDQLLGCAHGPLRIKCHDALRNIIWHALLMDDKGAAREQHSGNSNNRPGDVYHPDFALGKSAYFDMSVRSSLQPKFLSRDLELLFKQEPLEKLGRSRRIVSTKMLCRQGVYISPWLLSLWACGLPAAYPSNYRFEDLLSQRHSSEIGCEKSSPAVVNSPLGLQCPNAPR